MAYDFKFKVGDRIHFMYMYDHNYDSLEVISVTDTYVGSHYMCYYTIQDKNGIENSYGGSYVDKCYEIDCIYVRKEKLESILSE